jgi:hypothetical protein
LIKFKRHIAIFLLLVFVLPIGYQPVHIILHHSHYFYIHDCPVKHTQNAGPLFEKNNHCYICEYEFTVIDLPKVHIDSYSEILLCELFPSKIQVIFYPEIDLQVSPRAPPCLL